MRLALVCALGALLLTPQAASAGGWWSSIHLSRSTVAPGERVQLHAVVAFGSAAAAAEARQPGRFHVHLLRGFDDAGVERAMREPSPGDWWALGGAEAMRVGKVSVSVPEAGPARATASFTVPELPPATYHLMLCDAGCAEPLADVIPAGGFTVADPAAAADRAGVAARTADSTAERSERRAPSIADDGRGSPAAARAYAGWVVAAALAGVLALLVVRRRQARRRTVSPTSRAGPRRRRAEPRRGWARR